MNITIKLKNWGQNTDFTKINIDTHSLKMHSAITQSSKNEKEGSGVRSCNQAYVVLQYLTLLFSIGWVLKNAYDNKVTVSCFDIIWTWELLMRFVQLLTVISH